MSERGPASCCWPWAGLPLANGVGFRYPQITQINADQGAAGSATSAAGAAGVSVVFYQGSFVFRMSVGF